MTGKTAKQAAGRFRNWRWKQTQTLFWNGQSYKRDSSAYIQLITRAYDALWENDAFRVALQSVGDATLCHFIGVHDQRKNGAHRARISRSAESAAESVGTRIVVM